MATALHSTRTRFFDKCGKPLCGGSVYTYQVGTTTAKPTYTDVSKTAVNTNPVILDSSGSAAIFLDGAYRVRVLDRNGVLVEDIAYIESWISATEKDKIYQNIDDIDAVLNNHAANAQNPHKVTKSQLGLSNVDNTTDLDKPVSNAAKAYIDQQDALKADSTTTYSKSEVDTKVSAVSGGYIGAFATIAELNAKTGMTTGQVAKVMNDTTTTNNGDYRYTGSAWVKGYDALTDAKNDTRQFFYDKTRLYETTNLVNPNQATQNGFYSGTTISSTGVSGYENYYAGLDYIPAKMGDKLWLSNVTNIQYCKADKTVIWAKQPTQTTGLYTIPTTVDSVSLAATAYIRISTDTGLSGFSSGKVGLGFGDIMPSPIPAYNVTYTSFRDNYFTAPILSSADSAATTKLNEQIVQFTNLVNPAQETQQGYFSGYSIGGVGSTSYANYYVGLDYIPAKAGDTFWMKGIANIQYCRGDNSVIWGELNPVITNNIYTIPQKIGSVSLAATAYIRLGTSSGSTAFQDGIVAVGKGNVAPKVSPPYNTNYSEPRNRLILGLKNTLGITGSTLQGKTWVVMGDSITAYGNSYAKVLADRHSATLVKHAQDGAHVHRSADADTYLVLAEEYLNITATPDIITIAAGTNDPVTAAELGTFTDRTKYTFYGALHILLAGLRDKFVDARIGYIAPIPKSTRYIDGDMTNTPYLRYKAIKEVCAYYGVPVWNGNTEFGASPLDSDAWKTKYMPDTLHPNIAGHIWYANRVEQFILNLAK